MKINKVVFLIGTFLWAVARADTPDFMDMQIAELTARRDALRAEIAACEENTHGYKIAGVATLAATGVGVVGNIALHNKIKEAQKGGTRGGSGGGAGADNIGQDTCATDPICSWERQCEMTNYKVTNCDGDTDCCAADGCPCEK